MMSKEEILASLQGIFQKIFNDDAISIQFTSSAHDIEDWDSLNNIHIIIAVEKAFKIRFQASEIRGWKNVGEMCDAILRLQNKT